MDLSNVYDFHQVMIENNLIMIYEGEFNQDITKSVLTMTERNLTNDGVEPGVRKKIYNVMVESLQNICKHQYADGINYKSAIFIVGETESDYLVISGNPIVNNKIEIVKTKIDLVNSKDKDGLKQLFKELRLNSTVSDVGGAGLGFVDMARKSENKLKYQFDVLTDTVSYFTLYTKISKSAVSAE